MGVGIESINLFSNEESFVIDPSNTILWIGAGVSSDLPTKLPLGKTLTDAFLYAMLGDEYTDRLIAVWNSRIVPIRNSVRDGVCFGVNNNSKEKGRTDLTHDERPRLEYLIGEINKLDKEFNEFKFEKDDNNKRFHRERTIRVFRHFADAPPNRNHECIAAFAKAGAMVVTSNFDVCIERAMGVDESALQRPVKRYGVQSIVYGDSEDECVYHFHGIATDSDIENSLGVTINEVSKPLPEDFIDFIRKKFQNGCDIVFVGYSGSDYFDVRPMFESFDGDQLFSGRCIFVNHCDCEADVAWYEKDAIKHEYLLRPFERSYDLFGMTGTFLENMCGTAFLVISQVSSVGEKKTKNDSWDLTKIELDLISEKYGESKSDFYFLNMFRIASQLNINPEYFDTDWVTNIERIYHMWLDDSPDTIKRMFDTETKKQLNDVVIDDIQFNNWDSKNPIYNAVAEDARSHASSRKGEGTKLHSHMKAWRFPASERILDEYVDRTCRILDNGIKSPEDEDVERDTMMYLYSGQIKKYMRIWEKYPLLRRVCEKRLERLIPYYEKLLSYPFSRFMYRTYYLFPMRFLNMIKVICYKGEGVDKKTGLYGDLQKEWDICMETPNLFDARKTIENRLEQDRLFRIYGHELDEKSIENYRSVIDALEVVRRDTFCHTFSYGEEA